MNLKRLLMLVALGTIWGASFLFIKVALGTVPPFTIVFTRTALAGIVLYAVVRHRGRKMPPPGRIWASFLVMGLFNGAVPYSLINWGEIHIEAGLGAIFNSLMPVFTVVFAHFSTQDERFSGRKLFGVTVGLAGVVCLVGASALRGLGGHALGQLAVVGAAASYAVAAIYGKRLVKDAPLVLATGQMAGGALLIAPFMILVDRPWTLSPDPPAVMSLLLLAVTNTALAYVLYYHLLARLGATRLSLVTYIIPLSGVFWGWLVLGERLHWTAFVALGMIMTSIAAVSRGRTAARPRTRRVFDPFGWAARFVPERTLHALVRGFMVLVCISFLVRRILAFDRYMVKSLWAAETLVYLVLVGAYLTRTEPVDRSRGLSEVVLPGIGALLPFALLLSPPAAIVRQNSAWLLLTFWTMTFSTLLTVWGMWTLRRSFSITVEARQPVTRGPYRLVRHPIYLGEMAAAAAVALWRASWSGAAVLCLFFAIQLLRASMEERKLAKNYPEYAQYARRTWWWWRSPP